MGDQVSHSKSSHWNVENFSKAGIIANSPAASWELVLGLPRETILKSCVAWSSHGWTVDTFEILRPESWEFLQSRCHSQFSARKLEFGTLVYQEDHHILTYSTVRLWATTWNYWHPRSGKLRLSRTHTDNYLLSGRLLFNQITLAGLNLPYGSCSVTSKPTGDPDSVPRSYTINLCNPYSCFGFQFGFRSVTPIRDWKVKNYIVGNPPGGIWDLQVNLEVIQWGPVRVLFGSCAGPVLVFVGSCSCLFQILLRSCSNPIEVLSFIPLQIDKTIRYRLYSCCAWGYLKPSLICV